MAIDRESQTEFVAGPVPNSGPSAAHDPLVGCVVSQRYRIQRLLGVGGMGSVYLAEHVHMKKAVALKVLHKEMTHVPEAVARFEREAIAAGRIEHPHIVAARDFGRLDDGAFYLALEFVEGRTLRAELERVKPLPTARALDIAKQIAKALQAAHAEGIVHRDLKPDNIMLVSQSAQDDLVKVLDFGIAKMPQEAAGETQLTRLGAVYGTPDYMAPEQANGQAVGAAIDLYALGIILYEMLSGHTPFSGDSIMAVLMQHLSAPPPPLPAHIDRPVSELVMKLLAKDPADRPESAAALLGELEALGPGGPVVVASPKHPMRFFAPGAARLWRRAVERVPQLNVFSRRVHLSRYEVPLGAFAAATLLLGIVCGILIATLSREDMSTRTHAEGRERLAGKRAAPGDKAEVPPEPTPEVDDTLFQDLLATPVYKRKPENWIVLGAAHAQREQWIESVAAYRNAVQADKRLRNDVRVVRAIRRAAEELPAYEQALNVAVTLLGDAGMDALYDLWMALRDEPKKRLIAETAYKKLQILHLRRGSKALRVRLGLEFAGTKDCSKVSKLVERAMTDADERSVEALEALEKTDGCGASKTRDCYPCLRDREADLEVALETAKGREAPSLEFD